MSEDNRVISLGEFIRTSMQENRGGAEGKFTGRDHSPNSLAPAAPIDSSDRRASYGQQWQDGG